MSKNASQKKHVFSNTIALIQHDANGDILSETPYTQYYSSKEAQVQDATEMVNMLAQWAEGKGKELLKEWREEGKLPPQKGSDQPVRRTA